MEWIIALGVVALLIGFAVRQVIRQGKADASEGVLNTLEIPGGLTLRLTKTELIEGYGDGKRHPVAGLVASVEEGGSVNRRFTVTRIVALGVLAAGVPKKIDDRTLYLTIEGPQTVIVHEIPVKKSPQIGASARTFAAALNQLSKAAAPASSVAVAAPVKSAEPVEEGLSAKLRELARLRDEGLLTDDEFAEKKAALLAQF
ncbi:SHOCT domain-containing protein [Microbacterium hydrocarbonoxydans]|uniref:SHOCT domain-containing protein n=1 Tax=Microbacterium hydrocarbonoxydans TaxID=273678 RepID=UPI003D958BA0